MPARAGTLPSGEGLPAPTKASLCRQDRAGPGGAGAREEALGGTVRREERLPLAVLSSPGRGFQEEREKYVVVPFSGGASSAGH